ncbi:hypothetical protein L228DRAFT_244403 [Xylona heveae TC161]|uniref:Molybdopterin synthase sulfur carrier subunit n=1 Tax=Xylona heveae (strain CBS 132557 / TC161) TaxID=1328760 RepID=A0A161TH37_XYLHT|nr:hypothetical protein L228DRAFT_244403 [Xylona heveae TC161]KZF25547.1 hypothetical protein L228DRAFT_244403 [Xylona heveae TC161]
MSSRPPPGHFTLLYFASATAFSKKASEHFESPLPLTKLFELLESKYPGIKENVLHSCAVTINLDYVDLDLDQGADAEPVMIKEGDEVAIIPPVSSG